MATDTLIAPLRRHCAATCRNGRHKGRREGALIAPLRRTPIGGAIEISQKPLENRCFVSAQLAQWVLGIPFAQLQTRALPVGADVRIQSGQIHGPRPQASRGG